MKFRTQKELFALYESTPYDPKAKVPQLTESESGDEALEKMLIFIPPEHRKCLLWSSNIRQMLFMENNEKKTADDGTIRALLECRVSTAGDLQDPRSSIDQLGELIDLQEMDPNFKVIGICLDFFKNGRKSEGRLIYDAVINKLHDMDANGLVPRFNAISFPEVARLSRRASITFKIAEDCFYFNLKLYRRNQRVDLAHPSQIGTLANLAAEAQNEVYTLGQRIARGKKGNFKRFRTQQGTELFGFEIKNIKDEKGKVIDSEWVKKPVEFEAKKFMYGQFLRTPNYKEVSNVIRTRFGLDVKPDRIAAMLPDKRSLGIILCPDKERVLNPETENICYRYFPIPKEIENDLSPADSPPWKYYVPEIVCIDVDTFKAVAARIAEKAANIQPSRLGRKAHRPRRENGKQALSGMVVCRVGDCRDEYIMSGTKKNPDYLGCHGRRGRNKRCTQNKYLRLSSLLEWVLQGIESFLTDEFPDFYVFYKESCRNESNAMSTEIASLEEQKIKKEEYLKRFISGVNKFSGVSMLKLEGLVAGETEDLDRLEGLIRSRKSQQEFLARNLPYDRNTVKATICNIRNLVESDPKAANEALRQVIDRIEIHQVEDVDGIATRLVARIVTRVKQIAPYFSSDLVLHDFLYQKLSTKAPSAIVQPTLIDSEIMWNFEVFMPIPRSGRGRGAANSSGIVWAFLQPDEFPQLPECTFSTAGDGLVACSSPGGDGGLHPSLEMSEMLFGVPAATETVRGPQSAVTNGPEITSQSHFTTNYTAVEAKNASEAGCVARKRRGRPPRIRVVTPRDLEHAALTKHGTGLVSYSLFDEV